MSEIKSDNDGCNKPASKDEEIQFPPFPNPTDSDFDEDICEEERDVYKKKFSDLNLIKNYRLHCTACDKHIGCSTLKESRMRMHPMLKTLVCSLCHKFYNSGEFEKGEDGSELYCRWCGQGGQVYCCSDCPVVFCAKCVKRNFGSYKITEIENTDDWKCFKCNNKSLWELRATCWALLRYCDIKNKILDSTKDEKLKVAYEKDCGTDYCECCKNKLKTKIKKEKGEHLRKKSSDNQTKKSDDNNSQKSTSTTHIPIIQVKKFASINVDGSSAYKKPQKRPISPIKIGSTTVTANVLTMGSMNSSLQMLKKIKMNPLPPAAPVTPVSPIFNDKNVITYRKIKPKLPNPPVDIPSFNSFYSNTTNINNDNINLSLDNLTQGLDMTSVAPIASNLENDDVVCTPDFPLEPMCEVTEDNTDDDVQCITPASSDSIKNNTISNRLKPKLSDMSLDNIIQMSDKDVTVNAITGGLKFRIDPHTLSSNKMYRLPDGRIFSINANPNMPGGFSATIVAITEANTGNITNKPSTSMNIQSHKLVSQQKANQGGNKNIKILSRRQKLESEPQFRVKANSGTATRPRNIDVNVPVEWYRYNVIDAVDALEYSLSRLNKLKKEATTMFLRTRTPVEMNSLHRTFEQILNTSSIRFSEIKKNLDKGYKEYLANKVGGNISDDDDVEILSNIDDSDDPIFIDENSGEDTISNDNNVSKNESTHTNIDKQTERDPLNSKDNSEFKNDTEITQDFQNKNINGECDESSSNKNITENETLLNKTKDNTKDETSQNKIKESLENPVIKHDIPSKNDVNVTKEMNGDLRLTDSKDNFKQIENKDSLCTTIDTGINKENATDTTVAEKNIDENEKNADVFKNVVFENETKNHEDFSQDAEMSEIDMIETLLSDDIDKDNTETII